MNQLLFCATRVDPTESPRDDCTHAFSWADGAPARVRGAALDDAGVLRFVAFTSQKDAAPASAGISINPLDPPSLNGSEGLVLSTTAELAFAVGGTLDGTDAGTPNTLL